MFQKQLDQKADATYVDRTLETKANVSSVEREMSLLRETLQRQQERLEAYEHQMAEMAALRDSFLKGRAKMMEERNMLVSGQKRKISDEDNSKNLKQLKSNKESEVSARC